MIVKLDILIGVVRQIEILMNELVGNAETTSCKGKACETCQSNELKEVLRKQQVIDILKISERTYYRHIRNRVLIPRKLGNRNYFYYADLTEALEYSKIHGYI